MRARVAAMTVLAVLAASLLGGCVSQRNTSAGDRPATSTVSSASQQDIAKQALTTARLPLPTGAKVLGADVQTGIDHLYRVSLEVPADQVDSMLKAGDVTALSPGVSSMEPLPGTPTPDPDSTSAGQDQVSSVEGGTWYREVQVDRSDPAVSRLQLWVFTT